MISLNKYERCYSQSQNTPWVFLYQCIAEGYRLSSEKLRCHINFFNPVMPDKAAFMSAALLCVQARETATFLPL